MPVLSAHDLTLVKKDRILFENLSFSIAKGELLYLRGPNGAGKTSLLRVLTGLAEPHEGEVQYREQILRECRDDFHQDLLYFAHNIGVNRSMNALENLSYWCDLHSQTYSMTDLYDVLAMFNLTGLEDLPCGQLSAGQQRRVALCRFWLKPSAQLWILDEPFTALDTDGIAVLTKRMAVHLQGGGSIIITSHQALNIDYPSTELALEYRI